MVNKEIYLTRGEAVTYPVRRTFMAEDNIEIQPQNASQGGKGKPDDNVVFLNDFKESKQKVQKEKSSRRREKQKAIDASIDEYLMSPEEQRLKDAQDAAHERAIEQVEKELEEIGSQENTETTDKKELPEGRSAVWFEGRYANPVIVIGEPESGPDGKKYVKVYSTLFGQERMVPEDELGEGEDFKEPKDQDDGIETQDSIGEQAPQTTVNAGFTGENKSEAAPHAGHENIDVEKRIELTDEAKEYIQKALTGKIIPLKNNERERREDKNRDREEDFERILLENGLTPEDIANNSAGELFEALMTRGGLYDYEPTEEEIRRAEQRRQEREERDNATRAESIENAATGESGNGNGDEANGGSGSSGGDGGNGNGGGEGNTEGNGEREPISNDIINKLRLFYRDIGLTPAQTQRRIDEWSREWQSGVRRSLPDEELLNPVGFIQEIIEDRIKDFEPAIGPHLTTEDTATLIDNLINRLEAGDLRELIISASATTIDPRTVRRGEEDEVRQEFARIYGRNLQEIIDEMRNRIDERKTRAPGSVDHTLRDLKNAIDTRIFNVILTKRDELAQEARGFKPYKSIEEIAIDIMVQSSGDFARGGKYQLLKTENGREVLQEENMLEWLRDRMYEFHDSDVDNEVDLFSRIEIEGSGRNTSIGKWVLTPGWFKDRSGEFHDGLKDQMYMELWLFNKSRNYDAQYRKIMGNDTKLPEVLQAFYYENTFTKEGTLDRILTLPSADNRTINFKDRHAIRESNQEVGQALRLALLTYYHITDKEMLDKIEGTDKGNTPLLSNEAYKREYVNWKRKSGSEATDEELRQEAERHVTQDRRKTNQYFDENGKLRSDMLTEYMEAFNLFSNANKDFDLRSDTQERIRLFIMQKTGISYEEARYAEVFALSMMRWTGAASRHDLGAAAYDSWTKVTDTQAYRLRQTGEDQGGIHGNIYNIGGFRRMGVNFLEGAKALPFEGEDEERSILEIIQGGEGDEVNLDVLKDIKFGDRVMEKFGTDHIARVFKLYEDVIETNNANFDKIVSIEKHTGRAIIDPKAANEWVDNFLKAMRYGYRTWAGTDYSKLIRARDRNGVVKTMSIAESLWGPQVYRKLVEEQLGRKLESIGNDLERSKAIGRVIQDNRRGFWKRPLMFAIEAELYSHRDFNSPYRKYAFEEFEKIYEWLGSFTGQVELDEASEQDMRNIKRNKNQMFFSPKLIQEMRDASDTKRAWLMLEEGSTQGALGLLEGLVKAAGMFMSNVTK